MIELNLEDQERNSDPLDVASRSEMQERESRIAAARRQPVIVATGKCLSCEEPLEGDRRFCGPECRDQYDHDKRIRARQGVR